jgi:hypothetical protein
VPDKKFELGDYVEVKDRIKLFYELYAGGRLVTKSVKMLTAPDGTQRVLVKALAYRSVDDPLPGVGSSWLQIPGATPYTRGSEVENAETSAWGRAIGALGILIEKSIASSNEIENKAGQTDAHPGVVGGMPDQTPEGGLIGTAIAQGTQDFNLRQTPDGFVLPFRVKNGSSSFIVVAENRLAEALDAIKATVIDNRVTVWGRWSDETTPAKGTKPTIHYRILHLDRIQTPDGMLPATEALPPPLFDADDLARLDAELAS